MMRSLKTQVPPYIASMKNIKRTRKAGEKANEDKIRLLVSDRFSLSRSGNYQQLQQSLQESVELNDRAEALLNQVINAKKNLTLFLNKCELMDQRIHAMLDDQNMLITQFFRSGGHGNAEGQFVMVYSRCNNEMDKCLNGMKEYQCLIKAIESTVKKTYDTVKRYQHFESRYLIMANLAEAVYTYKDILSHYDNGIVALKVNIQGLESVIKQIAAILCVC